ncbi:GntR family transcriptional regulator [Streptosporangium amethystogenes]|uniref:GntR family transcriptional regulator n=1 Tax=Streptosporangium amethystogenes TaxID=2002 RepID=UPI00361173EA
MQETASVKRGAQARVAHQLRARITQGNLMPGAVLSESALAQEFGVSRTPIREALKQLQTEGMVVIKPRVGTFVSAPSRLEINELFEVKEILEGAAARLFAARGNIPELELLRENVRRSDEAVAAGDLDRFVALVHEYHDLIITGAGNSKLTQHYRTLMNQLLYSRFVHMSLRRSGRAPQSDHEHQSILQAIEARDGVTAERLMRDHVRASQQALMDVLNFDGAEHRLSGPTSPAP